MKFLAPKWPIYRTKTRGLQFTGWPVPLKTHSAHPPLISKYVPCAWSSFTFLLYGMHCTIYINTLAHADVYIYIFMCYLPPRLFALLNWSASQASLGFFSLKSLSMSRYSFTSVFTQLVNIRLINNPFIHLSYLFFFHSGPNKKECADQRVTKLNCTYSLSPYDKSTMY